MSQRVALSDFHQAMEAANVVALWELEDTTNRPPEPPHIWRWETLEPLLLMTARCEATRMTTPSAGCCVTFYSEPGAAWKSGRSRGFGPSRRLQSHGP